MERPIDVYALKRRHEERHPGSYYFDRDTLKWWGERMSDMRLLKGTVIVKSAGKERECYMISKRSTNFSGKRVRTYGYFDVETFDIVNPD